MTISEILNVNISPSEEIWLCGMMAESVPEPDIEKDLKMHMSGLKDNFEPDTIRLIQDAKNDLLFKLKIHREDD